jgi:L-ascorbate metabolism protein UlaG (beta-lactamase superfamily)
VLVRTSRLLAAAVLVAGCLLAAPSAAAAPQVAAPATATPPVDLAATIAERSRFFGVEHVDQRTGALPRDEVHLSWVSVSTFAAALDGHVVLFDAYVHKGEEQRAYVPATTQDLIALHPAAILLGHGHYDHGQLAGPIAAATGATIVGTRGHCDQASADAGKQLACVVAFEDDAAFGATKGISVVPGVCTTALLHVHSAAEPPDLERDPTNPAVGTPDPGVVLEHPPGPGTTVFAPGDEHGTVLYQLRIGHFALTMHDSSGPLKEQAPEVFDVLRGLRPTDVQVGALVSFNNPTNGLRDAAMYVDALQPKVFVPNHHDFIGGEYGGADEYEPQLERELADYDVDPELRFLYDPFDYVRPNLLRFDVNSPRWVDREVPCTRAAGAARAVAAGGAAAQGAPTVAKVPLAATGAGVTVAAGGLALLVCVVVLRRRQRPA